MKRRAVVEPVIGHMKTDHRMDRNHFAGAIGDAINAVLAGFGYNSRRLLAWKRLLLFPLWIAIAAATRPPQACQLG